jgi:hypothetical protein
MTEKTRALARKFGEYTAVITFAMLLLTGTRFALVEMGYLPPISPGERVSAVQAQMDTNRLKHIVLDSLPGRMDRIEHRVDSLALSQDDATREREAVLWLSCAMARQQLSPLQLPQICSEVRRR